MSSSFQKKLRLAAMMQQLGFSAIIGKMRNPAKVVLRRLLPEDFRRRIIQKQQARADQKGFVHGNTYFWRGRASQRWPHIEARIFMLAALEDKSALQDFVRQTFESYSAAHAMALSLMARSGLTKSCLRDVLRAADGSEDGALAGRIRKSVAFAADLMSAALLLLPEYEAAKFLRLVEISHPRGPAQYQKLLKAQSYTPASEGFRFMGTIPVSPSRKPAAHRLIICDTVQNPAEISLLFEGAEKVTVIAPSNLFGKISFPEDRPLHARPAEINIAHFRSRITRFSAGYQQLHDETWHVAEEIIREAEEETGNSLGPARNYAALHLADALFFPALQIAAVEDFLQAPEYDQVVIAIAGRQGLVRFLAGVMTDDRVRTDMRIEFVSLAPDQGRRGTMADAVDTALKKSGNSAEAASVQGARGIQIADLMEALEVDTRDLAGKMRSFRTDPHQGDGRKRHLLFVSTAISAYNESSVTFLDILGRHFDLVTGFVGKDVRQFFSSVPAENLPPGQSIQLLDAPVARHEILRTCMAAILERVRLRLVSENRARLSALVLEQRGSQIARDSLLGSYAMWSLWKSWIGQMKATGAPPEAVIISPMRPAFAGMAAAAAREFGIPSMALEPHGLNGTYCRYARVPTDRYGVISSYFRKEAARDLGVSADRIDIVGSPRLISDAGRDEKTAHAEAIARLEELNPGLTFDGKQKSLVFFSQPSDWKQISAVWKIIVDAMADVPGLRILLKLHPEEGQARAAGFLAIAETKNMPDRVVIVTGTAVDAIEVADLVMTGYSATAVEAAIKGKPVFCVTNGATNYPLPQHDVIGAPLFRNVDDLRQALQDFAQDPTGVLDTAQQFLRNEPQFLTGPEEPLLRSVTALIDSKSPLRPESDLPERLFLEGPFESFQI